VTPRAESRVPLVLIRENTRRNDLPLMCTSGHLTDGWMDGWSGSTNDQQFEQNAISGVLSC
jgi:hypothetical protein